MSLPSGSLRSGSGDLNAPLTTTQPEQIGRKPDSGSALPTNGNNVGFGNVGDGNIGNGNLGYNNLGAANRGNVNIGAGNVGDGNVGFGNVGNSNVGFGNAGDANIGFANTGTGNFGFANTGTGNIGIGLTGDYQIGFGGFNSGTANIGLFNSGTGNQGLFNSGSGNVGLGNAGNASFGLLNAGNGSTGLLNSGDGNTGLLNSGDFNTGSLNAGSSNTGGLNAGDKNTGWLNTGDKNTGIANSGDVNTGAFNSGNYNNGFFVAEDNQGWVAVNLGFDIPELSYTFTTSIPVEQVVDLAGQSITLSGFDWAGTTGSPSDWITYTVDPLSIPSSTLDISGATITVGSPQTTVDVAVTVTIGPGRVTLVDIPAAPGFFNTTAEASSGFFNTGAGGGSGFFNSGAGVSGLFNVALQALLGAVSGTSGLLNYGGRASGMANLGAAASGLFNTGASDGPGPARFAGLALGGIGALGVQRPGLFGFDIGATISELPITVTGQVPVNIPITVSMPGGATLNGFSLGPITGNVDLTVPKTDISATDPQFSVPVQLSDVTVAPDGPLLTGMLGGPGTIIPFTLKGGLGSFRISLLDNLSGIRISGAAPPEPGVTAGAGIPFWIAGDIPIDIPLAADLGGLTLQQFTVNSGGYNIDITDWPSGDAITDLWIGPNTFFPSSQIPIGPVTLDLPTLNAQLGGPGTGIAVDLAGEIGPALVSVTGWQSLLGAAAARLGTLNLAVTGVDNPVVPITLAGGADVAIPFNLAPFSLTTPEVAVPPMQIGNPAGMVWCPLNGGGDGCGSDPVWSTYVRGLLFETSSASIPSTLVVFNGASAVFDASLPVGAVAGVGPVPITINLLGLLNLANDPSLTIGAFPYTYGIGADLAATWDAVIGSVASYSILPTMLEIPAQLWEYLGPVNGSPGDSCNETYRYCWTGLGPLPDEDEANWSGTFTIPVLGAFEVFYPGGSMGGSALQKFGVAGGGTVGPFSAS